MEKLLRGIVTELVHSGSIHRADWSAERVGRNQVWRISSETRGVPNCYVKVVGEREWYERELDGLKVARELEACHDWIMAPTVVFTDPTRLALVTSALPGRSGNSLLREAYRRDKNLLGRRAPIERFREALRHVISWLHEFHRQEVERAHVYVDHKTASVYERVLRKLDRAINEADFQIDGSLRSNVEALSVEDERAAYSLVCGDVSLSNFYWKGGSVGRIDFEDIGIGAPGRDFGILRLHIERITGLPWYKQDRELERIIPEGAPGVAGLLHALEWKLDYHWSAHQRGSRWSKNALHKEIVAMLQATF